MTETAFRSISPDVLTAWDFHLIDTEVWAQELSAERDRLGRDVFTRQWGSRWQQVVGLQDTGEPLAGWVRLKKYPFLVPARGAKGDLAREWLARHQPPPGPEQTLEAFGVWGCFRNAHRVYTPGVVRLGDGLYVNWGCDTGWDGGEHFQRIRLSEFYAKQEEFGLLPSHSDPPGRASTGKVAMHTGSGRKA